MAVQVNQEKCTGCGKCAAVCAQGAIQIVNEIAVINDNRCIECGVCGQVCPHHAIYTGVGSDEQFSQNQEKMFSISSNNPYIERGRSSGMRSGRGRRKGHHGGQGRGRGCGGRRN